MIRRALGATQKYKMTHFFIINNVSKCEFRGPPECECAFRHTFPSENVKLPVEFNFWVAKRDPFFARTLSFPKGLLPSATIPQIHEGNGGPRSRDFISGFRIFPGHENENVRGLTFHFPMNPLIFRRWQFSYGFS